MSQVNKDDLALFQELIDRYRYDFEKLVYVIWPFGIEGTELEGMEPYDWQIEEWRKLSWHLQSPLTRYTTYKLAVSSGNGAAKTAFCAMTNIMLMFTQQLRARITANTDPQMKSVIWPEYDKWFRLARFGDVFFEKLGTSIKARDPKLGETWRLDTITWDESNPAAVSGLHNAGKAVAYTFEEAPGIPAVIFQYAMGAFTDADTIKIVMAVGNSDDPDSYFEQCMQSPFWNTRRIDTRTLKHIDPEQIKTWLMECGGDENADDFRVRVRGLPRKAARDSIIKLESVEAALERGVKYDTRQVSNLPCILMCDPAWTGGDETTIWYRQGPYACMLEKYRLNKESGEDHMVTFLKLCEWEKTLKADVVFIDQGEGTAIKTLANNSGRHHWELIAFGGSPTDNVDTKASEYHNIRAQMYYEAEKFLQGGGVLAVRDPAWTESVRKQLCWTKGGRHKVTAKKLAESKIDIKKRVGQSPDVADGFVLAFARVVQERLPENDLYGGRDHFVAGDKPIMVANIYNPYDDDAMEVSYRELYD